MRILTIFILLIIFVTALSKIEAKELEEITICKELQDVGFEIECVASSIINSSDEIADSILFEELFKHWRNRDGAMGRALSAAFLKIMENKPELFFSHMEKNRKIFYQWLGRLWLYSFIWQGDGPSPLNEKKIKLIRFLESYKFEKSEYNRMKEEVIEELTSIEPGQVE